jgi:hypothetical protein
MNKMTLLRGRKPAARPVRLFSMSTDEGRKATNLETEFNLLHPSHSLGSRGLVHNDTSVLTKRSGLVPARNPMGG